MSYISRKTWIKYNGAIPIDANNRPFEVHHIDGNHSNNDIDNLSCIPIQEHYNIHYGQRDYGACVLITKRLQLPVTYISDIQRGCKRPGIGEVKKGTIPWNKGKSGYNINITEQGKLAKSQAVKYRAIIQDSLADDIRILYSDTMNITDLKIGRVQKNGRVYTYKTAFCNHFAIIYNVTSAYIRRIIDKKSKCS